MTLASTRTSLIHRLTVQRDDSLAAEPNAWGNPSTPDWQDHLADVPCRAWTAVGNSFHDIGSVKPSSLVVIEDRRAMVPLGTDIVETDRVLTITYRGQEIFDGPMTVWAVLDYPDHLELVLRRVR